LQQSRLSAKNTFKMLPVLRGFSRNVKQDSEVSNANGGMAIRNEPCPRRICADQDTCKKYFQNVAVATYFSS
jgi:hypothetical protein